MGSEDPLVTERERTGSVKVGPTDLRCLCSLKFSLGTAAGQEPSTISCGVSSRPRQTRRFAHIALATRRWLGGQRPKERTGSGRIWFISKSSSLPLISALYSPLYTPSSFPLPSHPHPSPLPPSVLPPPTMVDTQRFAIWHPPGMSTEAKKPAPVPIIPDQPQALNKNIENLVKDFKWNESFGPPKSSPGSNLQAAHPVRLLVHTPKCGEPTDPLGNAPEQDGRG
jgi:hypothetical protein